MLFIDDTPGISALQLRTKARRLHAEYGLDLIMVDYLQLMSGDFRAENRVQEISYISRALKGLARELGVPVVAASQLSRAVEQRHDKRPILSDLRESGSIEQDADVVMFIYRDEMYNADTELKNIAGQASPRSHRHRAALFPQTTGSIRGRRSVPPQPRVLKVHERVSWLPAWQNAAGLATGSGFQRVVAAHR
jgi:replicative DNA helicase